MRTLVPLILLILAGPSTSFATAAALHQSALPEPGLLALLGTGLVGLASLLRRYLSD